jgi:CDP-glucose 4,6-dehydratase
MNASSKARAWDPAFWSGRRVLLTGHTGFKGAWLAAWLSALGARVTGFSLPAPARESQAWQRMAAGLRAQGVADLRGDLNDDAAVAGAVAAAEPQIVLHLAAQAIVLDSYTAPVATWETNVMGTLRLLQAVAARGRPCTFVGVTSDKCYDNKGWAWGYREIDPLGGKDPYSASKGACEILLASWRASFSAQTGVHVASARAGNVIGGGDDSPHRIVPDLMRAFAAGEPAFVRNPAATRPYQHVLEPLSGYMLLARFVHEDPARFTQAYNFGPHADGEQRNDWLAQCAAGAWGDAAHVVMNREAMSAAEAHVLMLDSSKARKELGWTPAWDARRAVAHTVAWHKAALQPAADMLQETRRQIQEYEAGPAA